MKKLKMPEYYNFELSFHKDQSKNLETLLRRGLTIDILPKIIDLNIDNISRGIKIVSERIKLLGGVYITGRGPLISYLDLLPLKVARKYEEKILTMNKEERYLREQFAAMIECAPIALELDDAYNPKPSEDKRNYSKNSEERLSSGVQWETIYL